MRLGRGSLVAFVISVLAGAGCDSSGGTGSGGAAGAGGSGGSGGSTGSGGAGAEGGAGGAGGASGFTCDVCSVTDFVCSIPGATGTASITMQDASGCSGVITFPGESPPLWIHCDTGTICVEHVDECFAATSTATSFSYDIPGKYTVTCEAQ